MKIFIFCFLSLFASLFSQAQETDKWQQYLQDSIYKSDDGNYVYLYKTKGGVLQKVLRYSLKGGRYVIATIYGDSLTATKTVISPNLFQIVYDNYYSLNELPTLLHNAKYFEKIHKQFHNPNLNFSQLGIRYSNLHYNHFPKFTDQQISKAKNNIATAMKVINELYRVLEEFENKE